MSNRISAILSILRSPARILAVVLMVVFTAEVAVMLVLPYLTPLFLDEFGRAILDAVMLTCVCAPALWWVIIGPLRRIAIQEHQRSETIVANANESIMTLDQDGSILSSNRAATALFGMDAETLFGKSIAQLIPAWPQSPQSLTRGQRLDAVRAGGSRFPVEVSVSEFSSERQTLQIAVIRDLTAAAHAENQRLNMARQTEALRAHQMTTLAQLATGVAHEIRNPLTSIKMLIQVNRSKFADEGLPTDDLELVEQEIRRMERSVNSLLDYARPEKAEFAKLAIQDVVRTTLQLMDGRCESQAVSVVTQIPSQPIAVLGDTSQIQQLLLNLVINALDAMPEGGTLKIAATMDRTKVFLCVSDSGRGIDASVLGRLFTPFVTTKPNGVGLGLGICRRIAEAHGGTLTGANLVAGGAEFQLTLPVLVENELEQGSGTNNSEEPCNAYS